MMKPIRFTKHAEEKFLLLAKHGCMITRSQVLEILRNPERVIDGYKGRHIAQGNHDQDHVLRIVYEDTELEITVVTFYPARSSRYESTI
ncbi:MAG: DUF4258 domain-containing protein [Candidatus Omnitrophota bacterium]|nr:MAG: DUF4258 domain-containing protein [Candidatus Omnitrophota bacterium]